MSAPGPPADSNLLELSPTRTAGWTEDAGRVVVEIPSPSRPQLAPFAWLNFKMSSKRLRLDEVGSLAWTLLDGRRTVGEVAAELRRRFGDRVEPAEERLGILLRSLHRGGLIGYPGDDGIAGPSEPRQPAATARSGHRVRAIPASGRRVVSIGAGICTPVDKNGPQAPFFRSIAGLRRAKALC